jgi:hypothetical protein
MFAHSNRRLVGGTADSYSEVPENTRDIETESHYEILYGTNFAVSLSLHINLSHKRCLTDSCAACCMLPLLKVLPYIEK